MDKIPQRSNLAKIYRNILDKFEGRLVFPVSNPHFYQVLAIFLSGIFLFRPNPSLGAVLLIIILLLDWVDGAVARKNNLASRKGWLTDVAVDRISEGLIFVVYLGTLAGNLFFMMYLFNILGSYYSIRSGKHTILPVRFFYLIYLIILIVS
jgi:phosphatidylglycerophosphate synthase